MDQRARDAPRAAAGRRRAATAARAALSPSPNWREQVGCRGHGLLLRPRRRSAAGPPRSRPPSAPAAGCTAGTRSRCCAARNRTASPARHLPRLFAQHIRLDPPSGSSSPAMTEISVVLPQPQGPTSSVIPPNGTSRSMPRSTRTWLSPAPKSLVTPAAHDRGIRRWLALLSYDPSGYVCHGLTAKNHGRLQHQHPADAHQARRHDDEQHHRARARPRSARTTQNPQIQIALS